LAYRGGCGLRRHCGHRGATRFAPTGKVHRTGQRPMPFWEPHMLHYAVVFFVIALIAALFGFGGIAASAVGIGKILFLVFAVLAVVSFLLGLTRRR